LKLFELIRNGGVMKKILPVLLGVALWVTLALAQSTTNEKAQEITSLR